MVHLGTTVSAHHRFNRLIVRLRQSPDHVQLNKTRSILSASLPTYLLTSARVPRIMSAMPIVP